MHDSVIENLPTLCHFFWHFVALDVILLVVGGRTGGKHDSVIDSLLTLCHFFGTLWLSTLCFHGLTKTLLTKYARNNNMPIKKEIVILAPAHSCSRRITFNASIGII